MTDREAMKMALEALRQVGEYGDIYRYKNTEKSPYTQIYEAIDSINEALAQPEPFKPDWVSYRQGVADGAAQREQEPVAKDKNK